MTSDDDPISISASLDGVVRSLRGPSRAAVGGVFGKWREAVGDQVADHVQPLKLDEGVLLATNTSSLSILEIADAAQHPERVTGMHFFNPVHIMKLLEIVHHEHTDPHVLASAIDFGKRIEDDLRITFEFALKCLLLLRPETNFKRGPDLVR